MNFWKSKLFVVSLYLDIRIMGYKYKINHNYFKEIDSEYKAYILGFIYADGSITQPKGNRQKKLTLAIQEEDGYILEKLSQDACGGQSYILNPPAVQKRGWKKRAVVYATSNQMCDDLISKGCYIRKSQEGMKFPKIEEKYLSHFIRGFLDGDGSIILKKVNYKYKRKTTNIRKDTHIQRYKLKIAFCSTDKEFLIRIAKILNIEKSYISSRMRKQLIHILWIENIKDVTKSIDFLYKDAIYFLERKYDKIQQYNKTIKSQAEDKSSEGLETT